MRKGTEDNKDLYLALLDLRTTPICDDTGSPTQRLMGRRTKTLLPTTQQLLIPKQIKPQAVKRKIQDQKNKQKFYYDRQTKELPPLKVGDKIRTQKKTHWEPAIVTGVSMKPRSYIITTPQGNVFRRNRKHLSPQKLDEGSEMPLSPQPKAHDEKLYREDLYDSSRNQSFQAEESENIANENDVSLEKHGEHNTGCQSSEGGQQSLRHSTRVKRRPNNYLESHSEPSTNMRCNIVDIMLSHCLTVSLQYLPARASEQGNVIGSVRIYIYIRLITRVSVEYDEIFHE